jgi:hypothetical protein
MQTSTAPRLVGACVLVVGACAFALTGATVAAQTAPADSTVSVENANISANETTALEVRLSDAPDGLSGYNLTVTLADGSVATLTDASVPDQFNLTDTNVSASEVTLSGVDTDDAVGANATEILLGEIALRGEAGGTTELTVSATRIDDDGGDAVAPATVGGAVTVEMTDTGDNETGETNELDTDNDSETNQSEDNETTDGSEANQSPDNETTDDSDGSGPGFGVAAAVLSLLGAVVLSLGHRNDD